MKVDVRIISATNRNLKEMVQEKKFREDLFFRLNEINIEVPPLRKRTDDINYLADHFLNLYCKKFGKNLAFSTEVRHFFKHYSWHGNVRELQNIVKRCVVLADRKLITIDDLPPHVTKKKNRKQNDHFNNFHQVPNEIFEENFLRSSSEQSELEKILKALEMADNNRTKAMKILGVSRRTFYNKLKKYNII